MDYLKFKNNLIHKTALINWKKVKIGKNNIIGPYVVIGGDAEYPSVKSNGIIKIGNNNTIREFCTINLPTNIKKKTVIGNNCYFMRGTHIAHDCFLEDNVITAPNVVFGGNVFVMQNSQFGMGAAIHQNQVIGSYSMIGMNTVIPKKIKIEPGFIYYGNPAKKKTLNQIGFKKKKITKLQLKKEIFRFISLSK